MKLTWKCLTVLVPAVAALAFLVPGCGEDGGGAGTPPGVWGWGSNSSGQLGDGTFGPGNRSPTPVQVVGPGDVGYLTGVAAVATGNHTAAVKDDGTVWAWGWNGYGQLGDGTRTDSATPTPVQVLGPGGSGYLTGVTAVACGEYNTFALKDDGTVWAWGDNTWGSLGDGTWTDSPTPIQVVGPGGSGYLTGITAVAARAYHTVALRDDGTVWAWGGIGDERMGSGFTPVQVVGPGGSGYLTGVAAVAAGDSHTVAVRDDGTVWAWGSGWLGDGTPTSTPTPVQVVGPGGSGYLTGITAIAACRRSFAVRDDGTVWAWGGNDYGQLGDGTIVDSPTPVQVVGSGGVGYLTGVAAVAAGAFHTVALRDDGTVWAWGSNSNRQLGDGTTLARSPTPVQVLGPRGVGYLTGVTAVAADEYHTVALVP